MASAEVTHAETVRRLSLGFVLGCRSQSDRCLRSFSWFGLDLERTQESYL